MKKIFCITLCLLTVFFSFCSCVNKKEKDDINTEEETTVLSSESEKKELCVTLGYYSHHSLNPFDTESRTNKNISTLIFDSLFKTDSNFEPVLEIAESYEYNDGTLLVYLKDDILFSDGSVLGAEDVIASFNKAKASPLYSSKLKNFTSATYKSGAVAFTSEQNDIYSLACLDFPVAKYSSLSSNSPIGSGRYILKEKGKKPYLSANSNYSLNEILEQKKINLFDLNETENPYYLLQIGDLSFVYNDFTSDSLQYKIAAGTAEINLNNMLFLSFNKSSELLLDSRIKEAICTLINKSRICSDIYDSYAQESSTPFNPEWYVFASLQAANEKESTKSAAELLDESGYIYEYSTNEYRSKNFEYLKLRFLVSDSDSKKVQAAQFITEELQKNGFDTELEIIESDNFTSVLSKGEYDIYLGEVKLSEDMNLSSFFTNGGALSYGIDTTSPAASAYFDFKEGKIDISTFTKVFDEYMPFLPICFKKGVCYYSKGLKYEGDISENDIFANIYSWGE